MVNVESLSDEEKAENRRLETLVNIAKEICKREEIFEAGQLGFILSPPNETGDEKDISVTFYNTILVYSPERFDTAMKLAEEYERRTGEEFTIQKEYED